MDKPTQTGLRLTFNIGLLAVEKFMIFTILLIDAVIVKKINGM